jgi:sugar lactone lactonase YvrE
VFIEHLPGTPDNINFDGDQTFWIAMPSLRAGVDAVAHWPLVRRLVSVLPKALQEAAATPVSFVLGVNLEGSVVANLQDPALGYNYITSATPCGDRLWLGSLHMMAAGYLPLPKTTH